ncbi:MAG: YggS family pyridoxal phosphate-dependent enzyme [Bacteroidetes bacterium]|nr:YggS family pyridoxal phosphate-dependent enzyme [Bacteroidota bacterium]
MSIISNYQEVRQKIQRLCGEIGRESEDITIVAVSKTHSAGEIKLLYEAGVRDFGENRVQELVEKASVLPKDIRWHLIGQLQTNKVKQVLPFVHLFHSVDRLVLADEIEKQAAKHGKKANILLQMRIAEEDTKSGCLPDEFELLYEYAASHSHLNIRGCMAMATFTTDKLRIEREFHLFFKHIPVGLKDKRDNIWSLGMSGDWETAIRSGSNLVRIGTAIFGEKQ